jgi:hypothetical protein
VKGEPITHAPGDKLDNSRIPMKPDGVIGLRSRAPPYLSRDEVHFPARGRVGLLLPFLVLEAKKEKDAPGFRAIQYQTAFAMRRFLKAQAEIDSRDSSCEPCLVWFFAYQGEQWRLHAGTFDHDGVVSSISKSIVPIYSANGLRKSTTYGRVQYSHRMALYNCC